MKKEMGQLSEHCQECGQEIPASSTLGFCPRCCLSKLGALDEIEVNEGPEIPGYEVIAELGSGSFGEVYECLQFDPAVRRVAVKVLRKDSAGAARLREEVQILSQLDHPGIARLLGAGDLADGRPFYAMELVEGQPLNEWLAGEHPTLKERVQLLCQITDTVAHAHSRGVIHRDLKPDNILIEPGDNPGEWQARLIDFGIARASEGFAGVGREETLEQTFLGTPLYMAPEQLSGARIIGETVDVHALGLLLGEVLGERPLLAGCVDQNETWPQHLERRQRWHWPTPTRQWASPQVASESKIESLGWIGEKACAFSASERYPSGQALGSDLHAWLEGRTIQAARGRLRYQFGRLFQRYGKLTLLACSLITLAGIATHFHFQTRRDALREITRQRETSSQNQATIEADRLHSLALQRLSSGDEEEARDLIAKGLTIDPSNHELYFAERVLNSLARKARELPPLELPFVAQKVAAWDTSSWIVESKQGQRIRIQENGEWSEYLMEVEWPPQRGIISRWPEKKWHIEVSPGGLLDFVSKSDPFPLLASLRYTDGSEQVAVNQSNLQIAATTPRTELARWDASLLGGSREEHHFSNPIQWMVMVRGTGELWMVDDKARMRSWRENRSPGFPLRVGFSQNDLPDGQIGENHGRGSKPSLTEGARFLFQLELWRTKTGLSLTCMTGARDRDFLLMVAEDGSVLQWAEEETLDLWPEKFAEVEIVGVSGNASHVAMVTSDGTLTLIDASTRKALWNYRTGIRCTSLSVLDGGAVVCGSEDGRVRLFTDEGALHQTLNLAGQRSGEFMVKVYGLPGGKQFLAGIVDELVLRTYDFSTGQQNGGEYRHDYGFNFFFLSADGRFLVSLDQIEEGSHGILRVWSLRTREQVIPGIEHPCYIQWVCFSTDSTVLATAGADGKVRRWSFSEEE
ncbi:serine/threonine-protein kinase [Roseibacillus persicicus]|uniref:protein kinase domain-containing protein n=1 Tax=Roseibacillus persicicus TaxID=454148 RepID=UPI00398AA985